MKYVLLLLSIAFASVSCGRTQLVELNANVPTATLPSITRIDPATVSAGQTFTIFGFGYSFVPQENILFVSDASLVAEDYTFLAAPANGEIESLSFTVPAGIATGTYPVLLNVLGESSNGDQQVTIVP